MIDLHRKLTNLQSIKLFPKMVALQVQSLGFVDCAVVKGQFAELLVEFGGELSDDVERPWAYVDRGGTLHIPLSSISFVPMYRKP